MHERFHKYFWSGYRGDHRNKDISDFADFYKLQRILEYASVPDLIQYPFSEFKKHISEIRIDKMWTDNMRKNFIKALLPFLPESNSWDELLEKFIASQKIKTVNEK